jgi:hypothetical protein
MALLLFGSTSAFSELSAQQITAVVKACVEAARAHEVHEGAQPHFDAYYNPASGRVQSNVTMQFQRPTLFVFDKCMAEHGLPIDRGGQ